jgi:hypothetical protein
MQNGFIDASKPQGGNIGMQSDRQLALFDNSYLVFKVIYQRMWDSHSPQDLRLQAVPLISKYC